MSPKYCGAEALALNSDTVLRNDGDDSDIDNDDAGLVGVCAHAGNPMRGWLLLFRSCWAHFVARFLRMFLNSVCNS